MKAVNLFAILATMLVIATYSGNLYANQQQQVQPNNENQATTQQKQAEEQKPTPLPTMNEVIAQLSWKDIETTMDFVVGRKNEDPLYKKVRVYMRETEKGQDLLMTFISPANMRGTSFLAFNRKDRKDEWFMYLRAIRRVKRIPPSAENFMLRDFLSLYLLKPRTELWNFSAPQHANIDGKPVAQITATAKDSKTLELTGYTKLIHFIDPQTKVIMKTEFYGKDGKLVRIQKVNRVEKINNMYLPVEFETEDLAEGASAKITLKKISINKHIDDSIFSVRYLKSL